MRSRFLSLFLLSNFLVIIVGCDKPISNPETLDPILGEIAKDLGKTKKTLADQKKNLNQGLEQLKESTARTVERKLARKTIREASRNIAALEQEVRYLEIRSKRRLVEVRADYRKAFAKKETWPPSGLKEAYATQRRLQTASKNWSKRVPKLRTRLPNKAKDTELEPL